MVFNFTKNVTGKILQLFFRDPEKDWYLREIATALGKAPGFFQRTLDLLVKEKILLDSRRGNLRFFRLNQNHPLYPELKQIISKTVGAEARLGRLVDQFDSIEFAFIFGSYAKGTETTQSDIDLLIIGSADEDGLTRLVNKAESALGREINYHVYNKAEFVRKLAEKNDFLRRIWAEPKILLKGKLDELGITDQTRVD